MKARQCNVVMGLLGCMALFSAHAARAESDLEACRGGYQVLLMTPGECRAYLHDLGVARAHADYAAVMDLQEWHTSLLFERSQSCPCRPGGSGDQTERAAGLRVPAQLASSGNQ